MLLSVFNRLANQLIEINRLENIIIRALPAKLAHLPHHPRSIGGAGVDDLQALQHLFLIRKFFRVFHQQLAESDDWRQRIVEVVGNPAGHLAQHAQVFLRHDLALCLAQLGKRGIQLLIAIQQQFFRLLARSDVLSRSA